MSRRPRPPESPAARRIREAEDALDLALEFRDPELAGGVDVLARRLEEAGRIRGTWVGAALDACPPEPLDVTPCAGCGDTVCCRAKDGEPCWGRIVETEEWYTVDDAGWLHACEGHRDEDVYTPKKGEPGT
jgi:hypothetical protein